MEKQKTFYKIWGVRFDRHAENGEPIEARAYGSECDLDEDARPINYDGGETVELPLVDDEIINVVQAAAFNEPVAECDGVYSFPRADADSELFAAMVATEARS